MIWGRDARGRFAPRWTVDPFDPRGWSTSNDRTITLDRYGDISAVIDIEDYAWARKHRWRAIESNTRGKFYASRDTWKNGRRVRLWLHKEVLARHVPQPSGAHFIGDHMDGDSLNDRVGNLRWATPSENGKNRFGFYAAQLRLAV